MADPALTLGSTTEITFEKNASPYPIWVWCAIDVPAARVKLMRRFAESYALSVVWPSSFVYEAKIGRAHV